MRTTELAPGEPAGWADWGILALRQRNFDVAQQRLERARKLIPQDDRTYYLLGTLESNRGNSAQAITYLEQATKLNPRNLRATYQLALELERQSDQNNGARFEELIKNILVAQPGNLAALLELSRIAAKQGDRVTLQNSVYRITELSATWPPEVQQQLQALKTAAAAPDTRGAATRTTFLRNVLMRVPAYRQSLSTIKPQSGEEAQPFVRFVSLDSPPDTPAPADMTMTFHSQLLSDPGNQKWGWIGAISLNGEGSPAIAEADGRQVVLSSGASFPFPGGPSQVPPSPEGILSIDFNYDFKTDLVLAGTGGVRMMRQDSPSTFTDVTKATKLPDSVVRASYTGAWAVDIEADGDMDVVLGSKAGPPLVLRNNGDGTFSTLRPFNSISGLTQFVWVDLNGDGNPDAAMIDGSGQLHVFYNERSGVFRERGLWSDSTQIKAIVAADLNNGGLLALVALHSDGRVTQLRDPMEGPVQPGREVAKVPDPATELAGDVRLRIADLDNNGALDLVLTPISSVAAASPLIWLGEGSGALQPLQTPVGAARVYDVADLNGNGRLDLLGLSADDKPVKVSSLGNKNYHWQILRPRAKLATGDQRINSFGIGGEIELRSGLLLQKQPISNPQLHFGLGNQRTADVARIVWPNGSVRAEFALKADQTILTEQRLKGSCPFLFAYNGKEMAFVKDTVPWGSAIGLRIDSLGSADINATEEWYKISSNELISSKGFYDLRITGELWETYYYDYLSLMTVDHPSGTEIYTDERFVVPAARPAIVVTGSPHKIARATDDNGQDVTDTLHDLDGRYLDTFGRGQYQGITRDHYVEIDLGNQTPEKGPLWLIARGWLHPSDSSINVAISQGNHEPPKALSLEVLDERGRWVIARANLGFPAGRNKICLIDLANVFHANQPRRLRLRTNLEIYWDCIEWAVGLPNTHTMITSLAPRIADLHYRGYSTIAQANPSSPEIPDYNHLAATTQIWHDLSGYYTRYGDVRDLLAKVDDRYVIMNAGDEMSLRFPSPMPPSPGMLRDYVLAGDGWIKDGDYNSTYSQTILPLPHHSRKSYNSAPGTLEQEWVYQHYPQDWQTFQTRYVTAEPFRNALQTGGGR